MARPRSASEIRIDPEGVASSSIAHFFFAAAMPVKKRFL
jgi:hypothetical protein